MIAHVETISFRGAHYLTELTYHPKMPTTSEGMIHHFVLHPGAEATDELMKSVDEFYKPPHRYHPHVVMHTFIKDYEMSNKGHAIFLPRKEIRFLQGALMVLKAAFPEVETPKEFLALEDYYRPITVRAMLREMQNARHRSWTP